MMSAHDEDQSRLVADATIKFNQYLQTQQDFQVPQAHIHIETELDETTRVYMKVEYNGTEYNFESIQEKDINDIYQSLNSQPAVRAKYADGNIISLEAITTRVNTLVKRFRNKNSPLYLYSGFVVSDPQTETFLGIVNLGSGSEPGTAEIARLNRLECWNRRSDVFSTYATTNLNSINTKVYFGIGTAETCTLLQYAARLKHEGYKLNGHPLETVIAIARVDNEGSWKSNAKAGMALHAVDIVPSYEPYLLYHLQKTM